MSSVKGNREPVYEPPLGFRPRQARGIAAQARVYEAAVAQFADKGVAGTRVEDVVAAAGVAWGTFFRYFPRKEDVLLEAAMRQFNERLAPQVDADLADGRGAREAALRLFTAMVEPGEFPAHLRAEIIKQVIEERERFSAMLGGSEHPFVILVARIVAQGQAQGEIRTDIDPVTLSGVLLAGTAWSTVYAHGALERSRGQGQAPSLRALIERVFGIQWRALEPLAEVEAKR